jgi:hypothetical protein
VESFLHGADDSDSGLKDETATADAAAVAAADGDMVDMAAVAPVALVVEALGVFLHTLHHFRDDGHCFFEQ